MASTQDFTTQVISPLTATIAISGTISDAIDLHGTTMMAFQTPAALTGTAITFQGSIDNGTTFKAIKDSTGAAISFTVAANGLYSTNPDNFKAYDKIKIVSGSVEAADRLILIKPSI